MEKEHLKMTNQARFIQMIIDGKLTVSKKKKAVLVQELKKLGFTPFPKVEDAKAAGEVEDVQEEDESEETEAEVSANDYDYLLGVSASNLFHNTKTNIS
jgi:DNA topoisomerase-2